MEIHTSPEFSSWFAALADGPAEDVATAIELIERLGVDRPAPGSSEWLLWYEHEDAPDIVRIDDWVPLHASAEAIVAQLERPEFMARLRDLPRDEAAQVMRALEALQASAAARRRGLGMVVAGLSGRDGAADPLAVLRDAYRAVARATGIALRAAEVHSSSLREIGVTSGEARYRLLYGVDRARGIALVVLGEALDRSFYGDAVRRAERIWKEFVEKASATESAAR
jgi:hypothetical protein